MGKVNSKSIHYSLKSKKKQRQLSTNSFSSTSTTSSSEISHSSQEILPNEEELFQYVDNRRFYKWNDYVNYVYPVDHDETDRSQMQHFMYKHVWGGNFSSPIEQELQSDSMRILDVGYVYLLRYNIYIIYICIYHAYSFFLNERKLN